MFVAWTNGLRSQLQNTRVQTTDYCSQPVPQPTARPLWVSWALLFLRYFSPFSVRLASAKRLRVSEPRYAHLGNGEWGWLTGRALPAWTGVSGFVRGLCSCVGCGDPVGRRAVRTVTLQALLVQKPSPERGGAFPQWRCVPAAGIGVSLAP